MSSYYGRYADPPPVEYQPVVPKGLREDIDLSKCLDGKHQWVRSEIVSGETERPNAKNTPIYWLVTESVTWCMDCHRSIRERHVERQRVRGAKAYYAIINPERKPFVGLDPNWFERWDDTQSSEVHTDWEHEAFRKSGWSK